MAEVCPKTGEECLILTAVSGLKLAKEELVPKGEEFAAAFDEHHRHFVEGAQDQYCSLELCGLSALGIGTAINIAAIAAAQEGQH